jgi:hypothetical protein
MAEIVVGAVISAGVGLITRELTGANNRTSSEGYSAGAVTVATSTVDLTLPATREAETTRESPLTVATSQDGPQIGLFGRRRVGGRVTFSGTSDVTGYFYMVVALAGAPVTAINAVYMDDTQVAINGSDDVTTPPWNLSSTNIKLYTGTQVAADPVMAAAFPGWTAAFLGEGCAYARIRIIKANSPTGFADGVPDFTFDVSGHKCYDPRPAAAHDINDRATWAHTTNAALITANYLIHELGANFGTATVDWAAVATAADICGGAVTTLAGSEIRYSSALYWRTDERHEAVLARAGAAHAGGAFLVGDRYRVTAAAYTSPSAAITVDDYEGDGLAWDDYTPLASTANGVRGVFASPLHGYELKDFPPYVDTAARAEDDGQAYWLDLNLEAVTSAAQAQRLAKLALNKARRGIPASVDLQFTHFDTVADDVVTLTDSFAGFVEKPFRVVHEELGAGFVVKLALRAEDQSFFTFNHATEEKEFVYSGDVYGAGGGGGGGVIGTVYGGAGGDTGPLLRGGAAAYDNSGTSGTVVPGVQIWPSPSTGSVIYRARMNYTTTVQVYTTNNASYLFLALNPFFGGGVTTTTIDDFGGGVFPVSLANSSVDSISVSGGRATYVRTITTHVINYIDFQTERGGESSGFSRIWSGGSLDNLTNPAANSPFVLPCACSPYSPSGSGGSWVLRSNGMFISRPVSIELWRFDNPTDVTSGTLVSRTANPGAGGFVNTTVTGGVGVGYYYRTRVYDNGTGQVSPFSSSLLLVFQ